MPVPVPAVLKLWEMRQVPTYSNGIEKELVTPTGAAIATTLAKSFGPPPAAIVEKVGLGAGTHDLAIPNVLRLWLGRQETAGFLETVAVLETQIDDLNPQAIGYLYDVLFAAGALDAIAQPVGMKKSRPGILLAVVCYPDRISAIETAIFRETTTLGIRRSLQQRSVLAREIQSVTTPWGPARVKVARDAHGNLTNLQPEYEDCAAIARENHVPWREVHRTVLQAGYDRLSTNENSR